MPRVSQMFGSSYLRVEDLDGKPRTVAFVGFSEESAWGETFYALHIADEPKLLKLTATVARDLATVFGRDEVADWIQWRGGYLPRHCADQRQGHGRA